MGQRAVRAGAARDAEAVARALADVVGAALGAAVAVEALAPLKGGYSREMWSFDARADGAAVRRLVLCADAPTGVVGRGDQSLGRAQEFRLLEVLGRGAVPVPGVLCAGDDRSALGRPFLVMERVDGTAAVGPLLRDPWYAARHEPLARQKAGILAAIHGATVPADLFGPPRPPAPGEVARRELARWRSALDETPGARTPPIASALAWLERHRPAPPERVTLVHGDYRTGNLMYGRDGIRAVLDWEMAHLGDPLEDVAWAQLACWQLGTGRVGGLVEPKRWVELYSEAASRTVDPSALRFWEVLGSVKMACLAWRAVEITPEGEERQLLLRLFHLLGAELGDRLLA